MSHSLEQLDADGFDLIGDIHGYAGALDRLLQRLGYRQQDAVWRHPTRRVIFLGDFIDRGPEQVRTVATAKAMMEAGTALAVMGDHEFNAVAWTTEDPERPGEPLRPHSAKHRKQHHRYLQEVGENSPTHQAHIAWFRSLPLFLDFEGLRVVHACWHQPSLDLLAQHLDCGRPVPDAWPRLARPGTAGYGALETVLKGLEIPLPGGASFRDQDGNHRSQIRTLWRETQQLTFRDLALVPESVIAQIPQTRSPPTSCQATTATKPCSSATTG